MLSKVQIRIDVDNRGVVVFSQRGVSIVNPTVFQDHADGCDCARDRRVDVGTIRCQEVAAANNIHAIKLDPKSSTAAHFGEWLGKLRIGLTEEVGLQVSEHLLIKKIDKDGNETEVYDSDKDDKANVGATNMNVFIIDCRFPEKLFVSLQASQEVRLLAPVRSQAA